MCDEYLVAGHSAVAQQRPPDAFLVAVGRQLTAGRWCRGADNNRAVGTTTASSFLNNDVPLEGSGRGVVSARGMGRPSAMTAEQIPPARDLLTRPDNTVSSIARLLGVSRATIYKYVPEVTTGRVAPALPPGQE